MENSITAEELISLIEQSELDQTIKDILIRDIKNEGVNQFLIEQVLAYCDNAISVLEDKLSKHQNPA